MTIIELVKHRLPFLVPADDTTILLEITQSQYALQKYFPKSDSEVEDEASYANLQRMLVAYYSAYQLVNRKALINLQGEAGEAPLLNQAIKKVKADVVETEFQENKSSNSLLIDAETLALELKKLVCETAKTLSIALPMCYTPKKQVLAFKVYH